MRLNGLPAGCVRIDIETCGVCHSDAGNGGFRPTLPGHEVVGVIDKLGQGVGGWSVGNRVGVGFLGGNCGYSVYCRGSYLVNYRI